MCVVPTLQALADAFRVNTTVEKLDLGENGLGDEVFKARAPQRRPLLGGGRRNGWTQRGDD